MKLPRWTITDLIDFESVITDIDQQYTSELRDHFSTKISPNLCALRPKSEIEKRSFGFRLWLEELRFELTSSPGRKLASASGLAAFLWYALLLVLGVSLVIGLVDRSKGLINVTLLITLSIGIQWAILILAFIGWLFRKKTHGALSITQNLLGTLISKFAGKQSSDIWQRLLHERDRHGSLAVWLITKILNRGALCWNIGVALGLLACISFLDLRFYWESTLGHAAENTIHTMVQILSAPWAWINSTLQPSYEQILSTRFEPGVSREQLGPAQAWYPFLFTSLAFWGALPRLLLSIYAATKQAKTLKNLEFNQPRHRSLWRNLHHVERELNIQGPGDEAVVIDCGGSGVSLDTIRPWLLQKLRINPKEIFQIAVIDTEAEQKAFAAIDKAQGGVVLLVEAWSLSPAQMKALHEKIRIRRSDLPIWFLVIGNNDDFAAEEEEFLNWQNFVDQLNDPSCNAARFNSRSLIK